MYRRRHGACAVTGDLAAAPERTRALAAAPTGRALRASIEHGRARFLDEWLRITAVPAPFGEEEPRARLLESLALETGGADEVVVDSALNVVATRRGTAQGPCVALIATLDDLGPVAELRRRPDAPLRVEGDRMLGPGVNTASSDAVGLAILRAFDEAGVRGTGDLVVAFVTGEETGLTGAKHLLAERGSRLAAVVEILGGLGVVSYGALGAVRLRIVVDGVSRHSLDGGDAAVTTALAACTLRITGLTPPPPGISLVPPRPSVHDFATLRVNQLHAGEAFNHSPAAGWLSVDMRGTKQEQLAGLGREVRAIAASVAAEHGVEARVEVLRDDPRVGLPGGEGHPLVEAAVAATVEAGHEAVVWNWSSSNVNAAAAAGIPAVALYGGRGDGRTTLAEWCDVPTVIAGAHAATLLAAALAGVPG